MSEWEACVMAKVETETGRSAIKIRGIMKLDPHFMPYTKVNSKLIEHLNLRVKSIKLEESRAKATRYWVWQCFLLFPFFMYLFLLNFLCWGIADLQTML